MTQSWLSRLLPETSAARRARHPSRKAFRRRFVATQIEHLEDRNLLSTSPVLTAGILSAPPVSPNGDGVQDTSTIQVHFTGATPNATQVGVAVENQAAQVIYQAPQVPAASAFGTVGFTWDGKGRDGKVVADGTYTVLPVLNGNLFINPAAIVVDTAAPTVAAAAPAAGSFARGTVALSATASDADGISRVAFYLDQSTTPAGLGTYSAATSSWTFSLNTAAHVGGLADGNHTWYARAYDAAGNSAATAPQTLHVDNTRPQVTVTNPGLGILGETTYTIAGTASDQPALPGYGVASVQVTVTSVANGSTLATGPATVTPTATGSSTWSFAYTPTTAGVQVVTVRATDQAGNTGSDTARFTVDDRPVVTLPATATANEGSVLTAAGSFTDPAGASLLDRWTATVNYGDGSRTETLPLNADHTFTLHHVYADSGSYPVTVTVTDRFGVAGTARLTATVANVAPSNLTLTPHPALIKEDGTTTLAGRFADPGTKDTHTVTIHWGDGSPDDTLHLAAGVLTFHDSHQYPQSGTDSVTVTVSDGDGGTTSASTTVTVQNVAPSPKILIDPSAPPPQEGQPITLGSTVSDPGPLDNFTYQWGVTRDGVPLTLPASVATDAPAFTFTPPDEGHYVVTLQVIDSNGAVGTTFTALRVGDVAPTVQLHGAATVNEGSTYTLTLGPVTDAAPGGVTSTIVHWGDGTSDVFNASHPLPAGGTIQHTYADGPQADTIAVDVRDEDGTHHAVASLPVTVANVPPSDVNLQLDHGTITEGGSVTLTGSFVDRGAPDTHTATIDWGDGSKPDTLHLGAGVLSFSTDHTFREGGSDSITVTVTDGDGGSAHAGATVTVQDAGPSGTSLVLNHSTIDEGGTVALSGSFADPGLLDAHAVTIDWGDGSTSDTVSLAAGARAFTGSHRYLDNRPGNAPYTITVHVVDSTDGGSDQATTQVTVLNVLPTPTITGAPATSPEGTALTLGSTVSDPGPLDTVYTYAWTVTKDGKPFATGTGTALTFTPDDDGTYVATLTVTDRDGGVGTTSRTIAVTDVMPTASLTGPASGTVGQSLAFQGNFTDPGPLDSQNETFAWKVMTDLGQVVASGDQQNFTLVPTAAGSYVVSFRVTNPDGDTRLVAKELRIVPAPVVGTADPLPSAGTAARQGAASPDQLGSAPLFRNQDWGRLF
jgi:hypothetical protein